MRVESVSNCEGCYFLKEPLVRPYCSRMGADIDKINVCLTGKLIKVPETKQEWAKMLADSVAAIRGKK